MKLEIALLSFFAALEFVDVLCSKASAGIFFHQLMWCVPQVLAQMDPSLILTMMNPDIKLPPKPPRSLFPQYYRSPQELLRIRQEQRRQQEIQLFQRLKAMSPAQIKRLQDRLTPTQLQHLVNRLKYLKHQMENNQKQTQDQQQQKPQGSTTGPNMVLSGANRIRRPSSNAVSRPSSRRPTSSSRGSTSTRRRRPSGPFDAIRRYQSYQKKAMSAMAAGCTYPIGAESMDSFLMFSQGGCASGGAVCMMSGKSCVDVGASIMCCPPGFSSTTLDAFGYMRQMQAFMAQFQ